MSIQLIPSSSARWIAAIDCSSSWGPQPNSQPPPPIAHAPKPTRVISRPVSPSCVVFSCVVCMMLLSMGDGLWLRGCAMAAIAE